ncbi:MAG: MOP flippase family protein [Colwellia sp.]
MNLKNQAIDGAKWTLLSTGVRTTLQLIQLLILARFLSAEDFGVVAIVMVVIGFSQLFMDMGISNAIIHKQNITDKQLSSLYWLNILSGLVMSLIVFMSSSFVASFYNEDAIKPLIQLLSLSFFISAIGNQYRILLIKGMNFNTLSKVEVITAIVSFICTVTFAVQGLGAYSLVFGALVNVSISNSLFFMIGIRTHKPKLEYHHEEIKYFLKFGLYQMGQNSIVYFNNQFDIILIGKLLGAEVLGIYSLTKQLVMRPSQVINPVVTKVTFPIMSKIQGDLIRLKFVYLKIINYLSSINFPIYILMFILATELVPFVLGEKWEGSIPIFQVLAIYAMLRSTTNPAGTLLLSRGRADIGFWWSLGEFSLMPLIIYIGSHWGILGVSISLLIFQIMMLLSNWFFIVKKMCEASFVEYFSVQLKPLIAVFFSMLFVYLIMNNIELNYLIRIVIFSITSLSLYLIVSVWLNRSFIQEIKNLIMKKNKI